MIFKKKVIKRILFVLIFVLVVIQFIPVDRTNPPVIKEPNWDSPKTKEYAERACFDCHSNHTIWPLYSYIAPISWMIASDVSEGRGKLNMSEWKPGDGRKASKEVSRGDMPLELYLIMHPKARLSKAEREEFVKGLKATFGEDKKK
jgi:hypothetical protein